jgi:2-polyprenyl-6-methoxyphenol hydroxylase-like FAD-dependent oxidoreductase
MSADYDVITVGGGLGGAALAKVLAEHGKRVLVIEREAEFKDRIRGEILASWGVAEAQRLGLYDTLLAKCAREQPYFNFIGLGPVRDLRATTPQRLPGLAYYHPAMQETVLGSARDAGAEVWRGAAVREVTPGEPPRVVVDATAKFVTSPPGWSYAPTAAVQRDADGAASRPCAPSPNRSAPVCSSRI